LGPVAGIDDKAARQWTEAGPRCAKTTFTDFVEEFDQFVLPKPGGPPKRLLCDGRMQSSDGHPVNTGRKQEAGEAIAKRALECRFDCASQSRDNGR
jgi:hypothetical protein